MFSLLRRRVPILSDSLTVHVLRHTWNDRFSDTADEAGLSEAQEQTQRANLNGWRHGSNTAEVYTRRHTRLAAQKAALLLQARSNGDPKNGA